jgi:hypothetical protein
MAREKINWLNILVPFVVLFFVGWAALWFFHTRHILGESSNTLSAAGLVEAFESDELAATAKYGDQVVAFTGEFTTSGMSYHKPWIIFSEKKSLTGVTGIQCYFRDLDRAAAIPKDKPVRIKGLVSGKLIYVQINNCSRVY